MCRMARHHSHRLARRPQAGAGRSGKLVVTSTARILSVFVTASLSDHLPRYARREPV